VLEIAAREAPEGEGRSENQGRARREGLEAEAPRRSGTCGAHHRLSLGARSDDARLRRACPDRTGYGQAIQLFHRRRRAGRAGAARFRSGRAAGGGSRTHRERGRGHRRRARRAARRASPPSLTQAARPRRRSSIGTAATAARRRTLTTPRPRPCSPAWPHCGERDRRRQLMRLPILCTAAILPERARCSTAGAPRPAGGVRLAAVEHIFIFDSRHPGSFPPGQRGGKIRRSGSFSLRATIRAPVARQSEPKTMGSRGRSWTVAGPLPTKRKPAWLSRIALG
jgi:hypothetical protein